MYKCFDKIGKVDNDFSTCDYVLLEYERDLCKLINALNDEGYETDGLDTFEVDTSIFPTAVEWDSSEYYWKFLSPNDYPVWLTKEIAKSESESATHESTDTSATHESTDTNVKLYNLYIILKSGITLRTNTEPITFEDITEAIEILQKPSIFGKQIAEFKIEVL